MANNRHQIKHEEMSEMLYSLAPSAPTVGRVVDTSLLVTSSRISKKG